MEKVRRIEIRMRGLVDSSFTGMYRAAFRGRGLDFDSVREYLPGDEVRTIDWNVTARSGRPFVKQFREERELAMMLLVDVSASGDFGSTDTKKRELAAELACVLALSAIRNNDRVGLILFSDRIERFVPPDNGRTHVLRIVREILGCKPAGYGTDIAGALGFAARVMHRRSLAFLISDLEVGVHRRAALDALARVAPPLAKRHDVIALHVRDPHEYAMPDVGVLTVEDAETGEVISLDTGRKKVRERFAKIASSRAGEIEQLLRRANVDTLVIDTSHAFVPVLLRFFEGRERRHR
jgi:uncharacterized protein (DUF58 family)